MIVKEQDSEVQRQQITIPAKTRPVTDRMAILLSELQAATATTKERQRGDWIGTDSRHWRKLLGRHYANVIRVAVRLGYLEVNSRYSVGRFTKSMRLSPEFRTPQTEVYHPKRKRLHNRIRLEGDPTGQRLAECFQLVSIPDHVSGQNWDSYAVRQIRLRDWYATRCPYRRFHSTFTGLRKAVRRHLIIDGAGTVEIDVSNSQPTILGILAQNTPHTTIKHPYTICGALSEIQRYLELCGRGEIYEHLLACSEGVSLWDALPADQRHRFGVDRPLNRQDIKKQMLVMMFCQVETMQRMRLFQTFQSEFPAIADYIILAKTDGYKNLARDCQRFESGIMIDQVARQLSSRFPLVTVHDSVIVPADMANEAVAAIKSAFGMFNVDVSIRQCTEEAGHQNAQDDSK